MGTTALAAWETWSALSSGLPADLDVDGLARETGALRRERQDGVADGATLLRLCLAHGPGGKSLQETAAWAQLSGVADLTAQSLNERLHRSAAFLEAILQRLLSQRPDRSVLWSGRCLRLADGSSLSQPGSRGTDWRLHAVYELGGGFRHLQVTDRRGAESLLRCEPVANEVLIADRGYARARELHVCLDQAGRARRDFIVRVGWKALALQQEDGTPFSLIEHLRQMPADGGPQEWPVQVVLSTAAQPQLLPVRLIALPLPPDKAAINRRKLQRKASKHQDTLDPRSLIAAGFMVLVTSLPTQIPATEIGDVYRLRWQIELAFKRLKSLLHIDRLPTRTPAGSLSWLYAHLILILLTEDFCQEILDSSP
jgi:Transposase DDE domain